MIRNPILPGFNPDPSLIRVGDDYYAATSTFEWFPGVPLYHSRDLMNWRPIGHALTRTSQLDLRGITDSSGIWAPSLSYNNGRFYLIYTIVKSRWSNYKDLANYLVTATSIDGPWSEPIFLNGTGFDPSLFHDDDGRKWFCNIRWDHRKGKQRFAGNYIQEYSEAEKKLVGPIKCIVRKPVLCEGPNLYKRDGWYYLTMAEGGTGWNHAVSMARSRTLDGTWELDPQPLVMTSRWSPGLTLQKAGHCELVQTQAGEWYMVHLASRALYPDRRCPLGRETCLQKVVWTDDGWLRIEGGGTDARTEWPAPRGLAPHPWPTESDRDDFDSPVLGPRWQSLRVPLDQHWASLSERKGWLRLRGRDSQHSLFDQSLVAMRATSHKYVASTCMQYAPDDWAQSAGLIAYYNTRLNYYLRVTRDEQRGLVCGVASTDDGNYDEPGELIDVNGWQQIHLRLEVDRWDMRFSASPDARQWQQVGPTLDTQHLSDDYGQGLNFTGTLVGLHAQDITGRKMHADFDYFEIQNR